jgi:CYTH domain-containing protein
MNKEIERKFAVKYLPENLNIESIVHIKQAFIYRDKLTLIRIRDIKESYPEDKQIYIYTLKTKGDIEYNNNYDIGKKYEIENEIDKELFDKLIKNKISNIIEKTRIKIPIENNLKVEIDVYYDYLEGLEIVRSLQSFFDFYQL